MITGGFGFIGGNIIAKMHEHHEILVSSRSESIPSAFTKFQNLKLIKYDKLLSVESFPKDVNVLIHLANLNSNNCMLYPSEAINVNIDHSRMIFQNALVNKVSHVIYFSTSQVYGSILSGEINESTLPNPDNLYSITHRAAEDILKYLFKNIKGPIYSIIRLSNSYGTPIDSNTNVWDLFVNNLCKTIVQSNKIIIKSNPNILKDFIPMSSVTDCIDFLINNSNSSNIYNLASGTTITLLKMAERIKVIYESEFPDSHLDICIENHDESFVEFVFLNENLNELGYKLKYNNFHDIRPLLKYCHKEFSKSI